MALYQRLSADTIFSQEHLHTNNSTEAPDPAQAGQKSTISGSGRQIWQKQGRLKRTELDSKSYIKISFLSKETTRWYGAPSQLKHLSWKGTGFHPNLHVKPSIYKLQQGFLRTTKNSFNNQRKKPRSKSTFCGLHLIPFFKGILLFLTDCHQYFSTLIPSDDLTSMSSSSAK